VENVHPVGPFGRLPPANLLGCCPSCLLAAAPATGPPPPRRLAAPPATSPCRGQRSPATPPPAWRCLTPAQAWSWRRCR